MADAEQPALRFTTAAVVGQEHARATWALAARELLLDTARRYHEVVTYQELSDFVQQRSLIRTPQRSHHWIGDVLGRVSTSCIERGEPLLSSLCVDSRGRVGAGYVSAVEELTGRTPEDPDDHAAQERLECHRFFGADLPAGGGVPTRVDQPARRPAAGPGAGPGGGGGIRAGASGPGRTRRPAVARTAARPKPVEKPIVTCPVHFTVLPASGVCDLCD